MQLFDFDIEVRPLLEVLVGKTVEQALMEVMEEEELAALRRQQVGGAGGWVQEMLSGVCCCIGGFGWPSTGSSTVLFDCAGCSLQASAVRVTL